MPRPKAFDPDAVLDRALEQFWIHGYEATSLDDLTRSMALGRASLYNAFGDKHALFLKALDRYRAQRIAELGRALEAGDSVRAAIAAVLHSTADQLWSDPRRRGCLLVNSAAELASTDPTVAMRAAQAFERTTTVFRSALERGIRSGELDPTLDTRATSRYLANALFSLRLLAKVTDREAADDIIALTLRQLG